MRMEPDRVRSAESAPAPQSSASREELSSTSESSAQRNELSLARAIFLCALGALIGTYSTLCGIGGGVFAVPLLHYVYGMSLKVAVANSLVVVAASTSTATAAEILRPDSALRYEVLGVLVVASWLGTRLGYRIQRELDTRKLKLVFCLVMLAVGVKLALVASPQGDPAAIARRIDGSILEYCEIALIGVLAGVLAPLLGIGGGLVAVPGLLLGLPALGYASSRACSTAMSVVNSWQSVWLYRREKKIHVPTAAWFAGGALAGGVAGDLLIHVPAVVAIAQKLLSATLFFVAARFAWDVYRERSAARGEATS
jgi:uncharacterized membrane protein YfcA